MFDDALLLNPPCAFFAPLRITLSVDFPGLILAEQRFDPAAYSPMLFQQLAIQLPATLQGAVSRRKAEYLASRYALRELLLRQGVEDFQIHNDEDRVPIWPSGITGSISHSHQRVVIALCPVAQGCLMGIDCEQQLSAPRAARLQSAIISPAEQRLLLQAKMPFASALTLAFSMKESLYKALYPHYRRFMGFDSAAIVAMNDSGTHATLRVIKAIEGGPGVGSCYDAHAWWDSREVMTLVVTPLPVR